MKKNAEKKIKNNIAPQKSTRFTEPFESSNSSLEAVQRSDATNKSKRLKKKAQLNQRNGSNEINTSFKSSDIEVCFIFYLFF